MCSCPHCQQLGGCPAMAWVDFPIEGFEWVGPGGEPRWYTTWPTTARGFCGNCGSTIAALDVGGTAIGVTMMSLDDHSDLVPVHQSSKETAVAWMPAIETTAH
ncbi:GFA family protein [Nocardia vinacea]|uniref:GFA family protein n=1 Tax=Nocardia vinacea TaxID=96468 RepID=UPI002E0DF853|nr:GFA family protein [Nocardia vinacea]